MKISKDDISCSDCLNCNICGEGNKLCIYFESPEDIYVDEDGALRRYEDIDDDGNVGYYAE